MPELVILVKQAGDIRVMRLVMCVSQDTRSTDEN